jgi:hypothetical protein
VAGVAVGAIFGLRAMSKKDDYEKHCRGTVCDQTGADLNGQAKTAALVSTIASGVGLAALGGAAVALFVLPKDEVAVSPVVTTAGAALVVGGKF